MNATQDDACLRIAGRLTDALHLSRQDHMIFRENIATYVAQLRDDFVKSLENKPDAELAPALTRAFPYGDMRWGEKLRRDIEKPYSDADVAEHLRALSSELSDRVGKISAKAGNSFPFKLYVTGSLAKGRFGGNSDLDVLLDSDQHVEIPHGSHEVQFQNVSGNLDTYRKRFMESFGERIEIEPEQALHNPALLSNIESERMAEKGYIPEGSSWKMERCVTHQKETPPTNSAGIIWSFADLP